MLEEGDAFAVFSLGEARPQQAVAREPKANIFKTALEAARHSLAISKPPTTQRHSRVVDGKRFSKNGARHTTRRESRSVLVRYKRLCVHRTPKAPSAHEKPWTYCVMWGRVRSDPHAERLVKPKLPRCNGAFSVHSREHLHYPWVHAATSGAIGLDHQPPLSTGHNHRYKRWGILLQVQRTSKSHQHVCIHHNSRLYLVARTLTQSGQIEGRGGRGVVLAFRPVLDYQAAKPPPTSNHGPEGSNATPQPNCGARHNLPRNTKLPVPTTKAAIMRRWSSWIKQHRRMKTPGTFSSSFFGSRIDDPSMFRAPPSPPPVC
ncbi:unnamed protein product [Ectocarpus sp. 12 AP-2014]